MKFLQVGLGSMGKRRIRNLLFHGISQTSLAGFDLSQERCTEVERLYNIRTYTDFSEADYRENPDAYIISTPPNTHAQYFLHAAQMNKHFFVEVATTDNGYKELKKIMRSRQCISAPSCTYRYYEPIQHMKDIIERKIIGDVQAFTYHMGQYLPDWHPWEDYRKFYVSKEETSACKEMIIYELEWLQWLLSDNVQEVRSMYGKRSSLDMKISDVYAMVFKTKTGILGTCMIDVISRAPFRTLRILGGEGVIEWDLMSRKIRTYQVKTKKWTSFFVKTGKKVRGYVTATEEMYNREMQSFLDAVQGKKRYPYSFEEDEHNFTLLKSIEEGL